MECPKCKSHMSEVEFGTVTIDRCDNCKGLWFDCNEINKLKEYSGADLVDSGEASTGKKYDTIRNIDCPSCKTKMIKMVDNDQPHIHFESCTVCYGVFLDAGELTDMLDNSILEKVYDFWLKVKGQEY